MHFPAASLHKCVLWQTVKTQMKWRMQAPRSESVPESYFSYFSTKTYVVGTQKNRLHETVLLSTNNICLDCMVRKIIKILRTKTLLNCSYVHNVLFQGLPCVQRQNRSLY